MKKFTRLANYSSVAISNPVSYALAVAESIDFDEPRSYKEAVKNKEAA